jgi:AcrR family transcriptional regulator
LLDAAGRIAGRDGLDHLTMVGVAKEAGVSRQLIYEHFNDVPALVSALVSDRFSRLDAAIAAAIAGSDHDGPAAAELATRGLLELPAADRHVVRALLAHASLPEHDLSELALRLRARMIRRWSEALGTTDGHPSPALIWAILAATFALGDMVDAGEVSSDAALDQFRTLLAAALS